jgi:hypothetical protein
MKLRGPKLLFAISYKLFGVTYQVKRPLASGYGFNGAPRAKPLPTGRQAWFARDAPKGRTSRTRGPIHPRVEPVVLLVRDRRLVVYRTL